MLAWENSPWRSSSGSSKTLRRFRDWESQVTGRNYTPGVLIERDERREPSGRIHGAINGVFSGNEFAYQPWRKIPVPDFALVGPAIRRAISNHHRLGIASMWTRDAGRLLQWKEIGSLSPAAYADLVIVDRDPIRCAIAEIADTKVLRTAFAGATVYDAGVLT